MAGKNRYLRLAGKDGATGKRFRMLFEVTRETELFLFGFRVNKAGDDVDSHTDAEGVIHEVTHAIMKGAITKTTEMVMDFKYGWLVPAGTASQETGGL